MRKLFVVSASSSHWLDTQGTLSTDQTPLLLSILAITPPGIIGSVVSCSLNASSFDSLLDTKASDNFVDEKIAKSLGLKTRGGTLIVSMASEKPNA